jgi:hypothetical protein
MILPEYLSFKINKDLKPQGIYDVSLEMSNGILNLLILSKYFVCKIKFEHLFYF